MALRSFLIAIGSFQIKSILQKPEEKYEDMRVNIIDSGIASHEKIIFGRIEFSDQELKINSKWKTPIGIKLFFQTAKYSLSAVSVLLSVLLVDRLEKIQPFNWLICKVFFSREIQANIVDQWYRWVRKGHFYACFRMSTYLPQAAFASLCLKLQVFKKKRS